jgi:hypothetical protein
MSPKLDPNHYAFYFLPDSQSGNYIVKGVRGNIFRIHKGEFQGMLKRLPESVRPLVQELFGITSIADAITGEYTLVLDIFKDFGVS